MMKKRLYKDNSDKKICGVCSGLAKYFDIDPTLVRLGMVIFACVGCGILAYIVCAIVMPDEPGYVEED